MSEIKEYIDQFYKTKVEGRSEESKRFLYWGAGLENVSTIYRLCKDTNYYPEWFPELCENYYLELLGVDSDDEEICCLREEIREDGYQMAVKNNDEKLIMMLAPSKYTGRYIDYEPGFIDGAEDGILNYESIANLDLNYETVEIRHAFWGRKDFGYRSEEESVLKTKISSNNGKSYDIEWLFPSARCEMNLIQIDWKAETKLKLSASKRDWGFTDILLLCNTPVGKKVVFSCSSNQCRIASVRESIYSDRPHVSDIATAEEYREMLQKVKEMVAMDDPAKRRRNHANWEDILYGMKHRKYINVVGFPCEHCNGDVYLLPVMSKDNPIDYPYLFVNVCKNCMSQLSSFPGYVE